MIPLANRRIIKAIDGIPMSELTKANQFNFFLSLFSSWRYPIVNIIKDDTTLPYIFPTNITQRGFFSEIKR